MSDDQRRADIAAIIARSVQRLRDASCVCEPSPALANASDSGSTDEVAAKSIQTKEASR